MLTLERLRCCAYTTYRQIADRNSLRDLGRLFIRPGRIPSEGWSVRLQAAEMTILPSVQADSSDCWTANDTLNEMASQWSLPGDPGGTTDLQDGPIDSMPGVWTNAEFVDRIKQEATLCRLQGTVVGDFLARHLNQLASAVRWTGARMPSEHEDRLNAWEASIGDRGSLGTHDQAQSDSSRCGEIYLD